MERLGTWLAVVFVAATFSAAETGAASFDDGFSAYVGGDYATALDTWKPAAEAGEANAQFGLGLMYQSGRGVELDSEKAAEWFRKAAEQGSERAQTQLGGMYARGDGVEQDWAKAIDWWRKAAGQGSPRAQYKLGGAYEHGDGVERDLDAAVEWYGLAVEQGYSRAQVRFDDVKQRRREERAQAVAPSSGQGPGARPTPPGYTGESHTAVLLPLSGVGEIVRPAMTAGVTVQFKSFRSLEAAEAHWQRLIVDHGDLLAQLDRSIKLDEFGSADSVLYRLRAGPFADAEQANALCAEFAKRRILCHPVSPE